MELNIHEMFYSIQGETTWSGFPSVFVRLAGCNLGCSYCDTPASRTEGRCIKLNRIIDFVLLHQGSHHVTITGGEPLAQSPVLELMNRLLAIGKRVQLETNGSIGIEKVPEEVRRILDVKTPSSGEENSFNLKNIPLLTTNDELKLVIADDRDFDFSVNFINEHCKDQKTVINFSPEASKMSQEALAKKILDAKLQVRLNVQLHKMVKVP